MREALMQTERVREKLFNMRLSEDEAARLARLADHYGLNAAGVIRMLLKERARELGLDSDAEEPSPKKTSSRKR